MKDMCALSLIPKLMDAGIDSLKIEGRMKNAYYVASTVHAYRTIVDDCLHGKFDPKKQRRSPLSLPISITVVDSRTDISSTTMVRK